MLLRLLTPPGRSHPRGSILVTGPQRSGTRIAAKMIASDLGYRFVDERDVMICKLRNALDVLETGRVVLQAPGLCHLTHLLWDTNLLRAPLSVVVMLRAVDEIRASCERINWNPRQEIDHYRARPEFAPYLTPAAHVASWKYDVWRRYQGPLMDTLVGDGFYFGLRYNALSRHDLWVPAEERAADRGWQWDTTERTG